MDIVDFRLGFLAEVSCGRAPTVRGLIGKHMDVFVGRGEGARAEADFHAVLLCVCVCVCL